MIQAYPDLEALSRAAAELFVQEARQATATRGRFSVALSGGSTPKRAYEILAQPPLRDQVSWDKVHVFWGDERWVPPTDARSNEHMARQALLSHVPIPPAQVYPMYCAGSAREGAEKYEALLRSFFAGQPSLLDLVYLGLGDNGHTLSLFPGTPVLEERQRWVSEVYVKEQDLYRVTMTAPLTNQATLIAFLVSGAGKATVLHELLDQPPGAPSYPAQLIQPVNGKLLWLVDQAAAAKLQKAHEKG